MTRGAWLAAAELARASRRTGVDRRHDRPRCPAFCSATRRRGRNPGPILRPAGVVDTDATIRYRIDGEIARSGMGSVLKGRDPDLGRDVALKVLREDLAGRRRHGATVCRGGADRRPVAAPRNRADLRAGTFGDRRPFLSMKLVKGHTLAQLLAERDSLRSLLLPGEGARRADEGLTGPPACKAQART